MKSFITTCLLALTAFPAMAQIQYPSAKEIPVVNTYHGVDITDNYQWLELENSEDVRNWTKEQNDISEKFLTKMVRETRTEEQMNKYMFRKTGKYEGKALTKAAEDNYYFAMYYTSYQNTPSLFYRKGFRGKNKVLVNSESISAKDEIILQNYTTSKDNKFLAYQYNRNGSDWMEIKVVEPNGRKHHPDVIKDSKHSGVYWLGEGFFYTRFPHDSLTGKSVNPEIRYHLLGQRQEQDQLIFKTSDDKEFLSMFRSREEDMYVIQREDFDRDTYSYYFLDPSKTQLSFRPLLLNIPYDISFAHFDKKALIGVAGIRNNTHLISVPLDQPQNLRILSPNYQDAFFKDHVILEDRIVMSFQGPKNDIITVIDFEGNVLKEIPMLAGLSLGSLVFREEFEEFLFSLQSYTIPEVLYRLDLDTYKYEIVEQTQVNFDFKEYKFTDTFFTSHDGTKVPIFIVYKNELKKDGSTPFLLKTYGGYGQLGSPGYDPGVVYFLENGGAFAYVHVRGGGKLGNDWWEAGKRLNKKNSYLDLISGAEYLVQEGFTSPKSIAITGGSHGGMVTAAAAIARPDLFGAAVVDVGITDMLRFENFSVGATSTNLGEFGSVTNEEDFKNLYSYSPYHNIEEGVNYPSMLITTGTHDTRVPPLHSYKFAARLQNNPGQEDPVLLWTQDQTGHFGASNMTDRLKENSFIYGFLFSQLEKSSGDLK